MEDQQTFVLEAVAQINDGDSHIPTLEHGDEKSDLQKSDSDISIKNDNKRSKTIADIPQADQSNVPKAENMIGDHVGMLVKQNQNEGNIVLNADEPATLKSVEITENMVQNNISDQKVVLNAMQNNKDSVEKGDNQEITSPSIKSSKPKRIKKSIFISYSPDASFVERKFVVETVRELKGNNLAEDIWFDKDEKNTDNPCWFSSRMEAVEKCRAAVVFLSHSFFTCPVSLYEGKILMERCCGEMKMPKVFTVLYGSLENTEVPRSYRKIVQHAIDLTDVHAKKSLAEKASIVVGSLMIELEKLAQMNVPPPPVMPYDAEFNGAYKNKKICQWSVGDLQEWLFTLQIKEFYRQNLAENMVDGFLLMSLTDHDMIHVLGIDSRAVRKKIMQNILQTLDREHKVSDNWHLRARTQRPKPEVVYIIYDPTDVRLAQSFKMDLKKKNLHVIHHDGSRLGKSKEDFLQTNGSIMATASNVIVILTDSASSSPFVFNEILFADWLGKKIVTAVFNNIWSKLRPSLKAVLGECASIDFEMNMYNESLDVLVHHIKPLRQVPGIVLEQSYLDKMADGLKPLQTLALAKGEKGATLSKEDSSAVFISYQWDMQSRVDEIKQAFGSCGITSWSDVSMTSQRGHSSMSCRSNVHAADTNTLQNQIQRNMKSAVVVLCCITAKYLQSDNCLKDLTLAETLQKPIVPLILRFAPLEGAPSQVRKILSRYACHDLSNDRLFRQNFSQIVSKIRKMVQQSNV